MKISFFKVSVGIEPSRSILTVRYQKVFDNTYIYSQGFGKESREYTS